MGGRRWGKEARGWEGRGIVGKMMGSGGCPSIDSPVLASFEQEGIML